MIKYNKQLCVRCLEPGTVNCPIKYACFEVLEKGMVYFRYMFYFLPQNNGNARLCRDISVYFRWNFTIFKTVSPPQPASFQFTQ